MGWSLVGNQDEGAWPALRAIVWAARLAAIVEPGAGVHHDGLLPAHLDRPAVDGVNVCKRARTVGVPEDDVAHASGQIGFQRLQAEVEGVNGRLGLGLACGRGESEAAL